MADSPFRLRASIQVRRIGFAMMVLGIVLIILYIIPSFRWAWLWFKLLPGPVRFGLGVSAVGLTILMLHLVWERWRDRDADRALRDS
jgi:hypothetical protein